MGTSDLRATASLLAALVEKCRTSLGRDENVGGDGSVSPDMGYPRRAGLGGKLRFLEKFYMAKLTVVSGPSNMLNWLRGGVEAEFAGCSCTAHASAWGSLV